MFRKTTKKEFGPWSIIPVIKIIISVLKFILIIPNKAQNGDDYFNFTVLQGYRRAFVISIIR